MYYYAMYYLHWSVSEQIYIFMSVKNLFKEGPQSIKKIYLYINKLYPNIPYMLDGYIVQLFLCPLQLYQQPNNVCWISIKVQTSWGFDPIKVIKPNICICAPCSRNKREKIFSCFSTIVKWKYVKNGVEVVLTPNFADLNGEFSFRFWSRLAGICNILEQR